MRERHADSSRTDFVRFSVVLFLAVSFGSMLTVANISSLVDRPVDELATMAFYWGYLLLPGALLLAAHAAGMLGKSRLAFAMLALCLLCMYFVWDTAIRHDDAWVWVAYWPACIALLFLGTFVHAVRTHFSGKQ